MIVSVRDGSLHIEEPDNFKAFSFRVPIGATLEDVDAVRFDGEHAWISQRHLKDWPPRRSDQDWQNKLNAMIDYARSKAWVDEATQAIRAHVVRI